MVVYVLECQCILECLLVFLYTLSILLSHISKVHFSSSHFSRQMTLGRPTPNVSSSALYQLNKDTHVRLKVKFGASEQLASLGVGHVVTQNVTSFAGLELNSEEGVQFRVKCAFIFDYFCAIYILFCVNCTVFVPF